MSLFEELEELNQPRGGVCRLSEDKRVLELVGRCMKKMEEVKRLKSCRSDEYRLLQRRGDGERLARSRGACRIFRG